MGIRFLFTLLISCTCTWQIASAQEYDYSQYQPFDSTGIFKEKVVIPLDTEIHRRAIEVDSFSLEKINYLTTLLQKDDKLVILFLLFDDFHTIEDNRDYGINHARSKAQNIIIKAIRNGMPLTRSKFFYPRYIEGKHINEKLHSANRRLECLVYKLP